MTVSSRAFAAMLKIGPPVTREVTVERDVPVRAPDGADLLTDAHLAPRRAHIPPRRIVEGAGHAVTKGAGDRGAGDTWTHSPDNRTGCPARA